MTPQSCLIVEDSMFDQRLMTRMVEQTEQSISVRIAETLEDARRALGEGPVSLILLDNNLPDGKGANFALELSKHQDWARIPIIIVSDWPSPFMWQKAQLAGVSQVVNKSDFRPEMIVSALPEQISVH